MATLISENLQLIPWIFPILLISYYLIPYITTYSHLRSIPAPSIAGYSNIWLALQARLVRRSLSVDAAHNRLGKVIRIQPNHISIADVDVISTIYGHGNGFLKSDYYDAFVSLQRGLFSTRDRAEHTRKRKMVSHTFSTKSVGQFEQYMSSNLRTFIRHWDRLADDVPSGYYAKVDGLKWCNYIAFDIIGDLAFGQPFGMLEKGADIAEVRKTPDAPITYAPAVHLLDKRGELNGMLGCIPALIPFAKWIPDPFFQKGLSAISGVTGIGVARVGARLDQGAQGDRVDLLARLIEGKDEKGNKLGRDELVTEALTQLVAGSDTTANSICGILYWLLKTPTAVEKLRNELDAAISCDIDIPEYTKVKDLPYLRAVMNEGLRIHSTNSIGLARVVPPGSGVKLCGHHFPPGTVLSVPTYTIHHSKEIWGDDADQYVPERWEHLTETQKKAFVPFGSGARACVGKNVAEMEVTLVIATMFSRYDFELYQNSWNNREGFLNKPVACWIGFKRRQRQ